MKKEFDAKKETEKQFRDFDNIAIIKESAITLKSA